MSRRLLDGADLGHLRMRRCGFRMGEDRTFKRGVDGRTRSVGVERCANGRCCTVCGPAQAAVRAAEVGAATWRWMTQGDRYAVFVSIAASHRESDTLDELHAQLLDARAAVMASDQQHWRLFRRRFGIYDLAWKIEHNHGDNGPHPGLHLVLLVDRWWEADDAQAAEAWLVVRFREELARAGFTGRLSAEYGIDVRPVDDPATVARYLLKWGVGRELAAEADKLGRNGTSVPYQAIPSVLADELGRQNPYGRRYQQDRRVRRMVDGWAGYVRLAATDRRQWYRGFRKLKTLVPELEGAHRPAEIIALCTDLLPAELRPARYDDSEVEDDDEEGATLTVAGDAWEAAQFAWWRADRLPWIWAQRRRRWLDGHDGPPVPLELAVHWLADSEGLDAAAAALADLADAELTADDLGFVVRYPDDHAE